jgi:hypothetical protein
MNNNTTTLPSFSGTGMYRRRAKRSLVYQGVSEKAKPQDADLAIN